MRKEVLKHAEMMETQLVANDYKGGWKGCSTEYLLNKLMQNVKQLSNATHTSIAVRHLVNISNYAMMLADNAMDGESDGSN